MSKVDWHKDPIEDNTLVTSSYKSTQNVRRYFKSKCGDNFAFARGFMQWMKQAEGITMGEAVQEWLRRQETK
ncbi:hypothetical protein HB761_00555 [Vibrio campbellii]|uniref:DUF6434 domain-containing protein n=1 Tax=Vibrio campbellii TaxID=680 RepID=A0AAE9MVB5_9VIBR|nr:DUF6434 domain-containing protein [Vibrio campbellii]UTZ25365.1 hypothetical protein HB761_00555 [Vibrio campbellii]